MNFKLLLICFFFLVSQSFGQTGRAKRAIKALDKEKIEKAEKLLYKALSKDSVNIGAHYGLSLLYVTEQYNAYNIDVAYYHINTAIAQLDSLDAGNKQIKKLQKIDIVDTTLLNQKSVIEKLAFQHVSHTNTIDAYNYFIQNYSSASQVSEAIRIRNEIAYNQALEKNTYDAYKEFIDTYPEATQIAEASELYEFLLYENKTKSRKLDSYIQFLKEHPNTNYTNDALENILELYTIDHKPESYIKYVRDFPAAGKFAKKAIDMLFHQVKQRQGVEFFARQYGEYMNDSLQQIVELNDNSIFPVVENGFYGFKNHEGDFVISPQYDEIDEEYLCGDLPEHYVIANKGGDMVMISHSGQIIFQELAGSVSPLEQGLLLLQKSGSYKVLHVAGYQITTKAYDSVFVLDEQYLKYAVEDKWGLLSFSGRKITDPKYDDIFTDGDFIVFENNNKLAIVNDQRLFSFANEGKEQLSFVYDDYELLKNNNLLTVRGEYQSVLDKNLDLLIPEKKQTIYPLNEGWLIRDDQFRFYSEEMLPISNEGYDAAYFTDGWLALKRGDKWALIDQEKNAFPVFEYDSLQLSGNYFALGIKADSSFVIFDNGTRKMLPKKADFKVVKANNHRGRAGAEVFVVNNSNNYKTVYNQFGKQIINGRYDDVTMLGMSYLVLDRYNRKGLADTTGNTLLPVTYDGLGNYADEDINLLKNQKFGLYNKGKSIEISPQYDVILKPYNDSTYIASKSKRLGLIDKNNKEVLPFEFLDIQPWNDSLALVKSSDQWKIFNLNTRQPVMEEVSDVKFLENPDTKAFGRGAIIYKNNAYGVITSKNVEFLPPVYDDIYVLGTAENPVFFAEKRVKEAGLFVVIYYNAEGKTVHQQTFSEDEYDLIYCY